MSLNNHNIGPIKEDEEIDPRLHPFANIENDYFENFQEILDNTEEVSENMNFNFIANINQNDQNETQNENYNVQNWTQNEQNETQEKTKNEQIEIQNEQFETHSIIIGIHDGQNEIQNEVNSNSNHEEEEHKEKENELGLSSMEFLKKKTKSEVNFFGKIKLFIIIINIKIYY